MLLSLTLTKWCIISEIKCIYCTSPCFREKNCVAEKQEKNRLLCPVNIYIFFYKSHYYSSQLNISGTLHERNEVISSCRFCIFSLTS